MWPWLRELERLARMNVPHALVTITQVSGSAPREPGTKMVVQPDGTFSGTIGGGHLETLVIEDARSCLRDVVTKTFKYPLAAKAGQCCGGSVEVLVEALGKRPTLYIFGAGHVGQAIARVMQGTPFLAHLVDERPEWLSQAPSDAVSIDEPWDRVVSALPEDAHAVVMTHRHDLDEAIVEALVKRPLAYIGLIGSRAKWARFRDRLSQRGVTEAMLCRVTTPLGLPIGGKAPQEVAISLAAELLRLHYAKHESATTE
jgi:xanthine dehydrogenase accessory factor